MGLDQYIHRVKMMPDEYKELFKKPVTYEKYNKLIEMPIFCFRELEHNEYFKFIPDKYRIKCKCMNEFYNTEQLMLDKYHIDIKNLRLEYKEDGHKKVTFVYTDQSNEKYTLDFYYNDDSYVYSKEVDYEVIFKDNEVCYWRKAYHIRELFVQYANYDIEDNCTFIPLNKDQLNNILSTLTILSSNITSEDIDYDTVHQSISMLNEAIENTDFDNELLCYYEWY